MDKILITGGSGFIGTNIVEYYVKCNYEVKNIDFKRPSLISQEKYWIKLDILDFEILNKTILEFNPDFIIHLAARTDLDGKTKNDYPANIQGVENLMKIAQELNGLKKIIITSSMLVCSRGYIPKTQFDYSPNTSYGESKVETEKIVWNLQPKCDWAIIRPTSIWGPWFSAPYKDFFDMVLAKRYFHIGNKSCTKTYGFVGNLVYQVNCILQNDTKNEDNKIFYIGDNPAINIEEWGNEIAAQSNIRIIKIPYMFIMILAWFGDFLKLFKIPFAMNSFRLKNMTTDNIINLTNTYKIAPNPPYSRINGVVQTLEWMKKH